MVKSGRVALMVLVIALTLRLYRIAEPAKVMFDEVVFGKYILSVRNRQFFFDVFPPLGKLILAACTYAFGWDETFPIEPLGAPYPENHGYAELRAWNGVFGSLNSMLIALICSEAGFSVWSSVLGGMMSALDSLSVIQSRIIMADTVMMFFAELSLLLGMRSWRMKREKAKTGWIWLCLAGLFSGLALGTKWTSFATPFLIGFISYFGIPPFLQDGPLPLPVIILYIMSVVGAYFGSLGLFIFICNRSGGGDAFTSRQFQSSLIGNRLEGAYKPGKGFWMRAWEYNTIMFQYQKGVRGDTSKEPSWGDWIVNARGTMYSFNREGGILQMVYVIVNPAVTVAICFSIVVFVVAMFLYIRYLRKSEKPMPELRASFQRGAVFILAWIFSMLPTLAVYRSGPIYQYLPALLYAILLTAQAVEMLPVQVRVLMSFMIVFTSAAAFAYWSPWVYSLPISEDFNNRLKIISGWQ